MKSFNKRKKNQSFNIMKKFNKNEKKKLNQNLKLLAIKKITENYLFNKFICIYLLELLTKKKYKYSGKGQITNKCNYKLFFHFEITIIFINNKA